MIESKILHSMRINAIKMKATNQNQAIESFNNLVEGIQMKKHQVCSFKNYVYVQQLNAFLQNTMLKVDK